MPKPNTTTPGAPCWIDLSTSNPDAAKAFYGEAFGWTVDDTNAEQFGGYFTFLKDGRKVAGGMPSDGQSGPDTWTVYLRSTDAATTVAQVRAKGGNVIVDPMPVADLGTMAVVTDVAGASLGIWQPGQHVGFDVVGEPGSASWFELHTSRYEASLNFYRDVFGWTVTTASDAPEFRYSVFADGDDQLAGVMDASAFLPEGVTAEWSVYFGVDDTDKASELVVELGGTVVEPAEDTPYGRLARVADPTGTQFKLVAPNDQMPAK